MQKIMQQLLNCQGMHMIDNVEHSFHFLESLAFLVRIRAESDAKDTYKSDTETGHASG